jgi:hypothetical protein
LIAHVRQTERGIVGATHVLRLRLQRPRRVLQVFQLHDGEHGGLGRTAMLGQDLHRRGAARFMLPHQRGEHAAHLIKLRWQGLNGRIERGGLLGELRYGRTRLRCGGHRGAERDKVVKLGIGQPFQHRPIGLFPRGKLVHDQGGDCRLTGLRRMRHSRGLLLSKCRILHGHKGGFSLHVLRVWEQHEHVLFNRPAALNEPLALPIREGLLGGVDAV